MHKHVTIYSHSVRECKNPKKCKKVTVNSPFLICPLGNKTAPLSAQGAAALLGAVPASSALPVADGPAARGLQQPRPPLTGASARPPSPEDRRSLPSGLLRSRAAPGQARPTPSAKLLLGGHTVPAPLGSEDRGGCRQALLRGSTVSPRAAP